jgi:hypothetical protein
MKLERHRRSFRLSLLHRNMIEFTTLLTSNGLSAAFSLKGAANHEKGLREAVLGATSPDEIEREETCVS